jgi:hypothetical protein
MYIKATWSELEVFSLTSNLGSIGKDKPPTTSPLSYRIQHILCAEVVPDLLQGQHPLLSSLTKLVKIVKSYAARKVSGVRPARCLAMILLKNSNWESLT